MASATCMVDAKRGADPLRMQKIRTCVGTKWNKTRSSFGTRRSAKRQISLIMDQVVDGCTKHSPVKRSTPYGASQPLLAPLASPIYPPQLCLSFRILEAPMSGISLAQIWRLVFPVPFWVCRGGSSRDLRLPRGSDCQ